VTVQIQVVLCVDSASGVRLLRLQLPAGATVQTAIDAAQREWREVAATWAQVSVGIWGEQVERTRVLAQDDRVEVYRALPNDPREARRQRARKALRRS
jgi:putative ubiquitin-RnfH superfamily antitoxin RatB of RatAB toxin-antitoxin module